MNRWTRPLPKTTKWRRVASRAFTRDGRYCLEVKETADGKWGCTVSSAGILVGHARSVSEAGARAAGRRLVRRTEIFAAQKQLVAQTREQA